MTMLARLAVIAAFFALAFGHVVRQIQTTTITVLPSEAFSSGGVFPPEVPSAIIDNGITYSVAVVTARPSIPVEPTIEPSVPASGSGASTIVFTNPGSGPGPSVPPSLTIPVGSPSGPSRSVPSQSGSRSPPPSPSPSNNSASKVGFAPLGLLAMGLAALF